MQQSWQEWLDGQREQATTNTTVAGLDRLREGTPGSTRWEMLKGAFGEYLGNREGAFYRVVAGLVFTKGREVPSWGQPLIQEEGGDILLVTDQKGDYLVAAREEAGNPQAKKCVLLAPPFQASRANAQKKHGGKEPPRIGMYRNPMVLKSEQPADGARFIGLDVMEGKVTQVGILQIQDLSKIELLPNERVFTLAELCEAIRAGECNEHLVVAWAHNVAAV